MSFMKAFDGGLVRELWPYDIGIPLRDVDDAKNLPRWRIMPATAEELAEWLVVESVESNVDGVERPTVLYHPSVKDIKTKVTIRVQGFVDSVNVGPLGTWDGKEQSAGSASQHITLTSSGLTKAFDHQVESLEELQYAILSSLCHQPDEAMGAVRSDKICLGRRVFHKIPLTQRKEVTSALRTGDDPQGKAAKIADRWKVPFRIALGVQRPDGKIVRTTQIGIRKGDFVDVSLTPEIITLRSRQGVRFAVKYDIREVVRLYTRNEFSDEVLSLMSHDCAEPDRPLIEDAASGFSFEDDATARSKS